MSGIRASLHFDHVHPDNGVVQVGWLGQSGTVYGLADEEALRGEPGGFSPLYIEHDADGRCIHNPDLSERGLIAEATEAADEAGVEPTEQGEVVDPSRLDSTGAFWQGV